MPKLLSRAFLFNFCAAILVGISLRFVVNLAPVWWLVWLAPAPLLIIALRSTGRETFWITAFAVLIGLSGNLHYYRVAMPTVFALLVLLAQTGLWVFVVSATRRIVLRYQSWWSVFVYSTMWCATDTLMAHLLPDGNWGSLAYSQVEFLPFVQIASLFGVAGVLFLLSLFPSTVALAIVYGNRLTRARYAYGLTGLLLAATLIYGAFRLQTSSDGQQTVFGLISIDDAIGLNASENYAELIWKKYDEHVAVLAAQGASIILLPEKIAILTPAKAEKLKEHLSNLAKNQHVWVAAGLGIDNGIERTNVAWMISPEGSQTNIYQKHHMAPPERDYVAGKSYETTLINNTLYGLAICKDMHFASLGRAYAAKNIDVMLVPAWDFYYDQWIASRMTIIRGIEGGYTIVRSSREGLLTVSDAFGNVLAERQSRALPGETLLVKARINPHLPTFYAVIGDVFGWLCVFCAAILLIAGRVSNHKKENNSHL